MSKKNDESVYLHFPNEDWLDAFLKTLSPKQRAYLSPDRAGEIYAKRFCFNAEHHKCDDCGKRTLEGPISDSGWFQCMTDCLGGSWGNHVAETDQSCGGSQFAWYDFHSTFGYRALDEN
jgi:hypothetical protein